MKSSLIEELYTKHECKIIREMYLNEDKDTRAAIKQAICEKTITSSKIITKTKSLDVIFMVCLSSRFATSDDECQRVAITFHQYMFADNILPQLHSDDSELTFAGKTLISLSLFANTLKHKCERYGAPSPKYYRDVSKSIYTRYNQVDIAEHFELWEAFLGEMFT